MTVRELSQLKYLKREIETERRRIEELRARAVCAAPKTDGMPRRKGARDRVGECATEIAYLEELIKSNMKRAISELLRLQSFINDIPDSDMRQIFCLRYIKGKSWVSIAFLLEMKDDTTARKRHDVYLREGRCVRRDSRTRRSEALIKREEESARRAAPVLDIRELEMFERGSRDTLAKGTKKTL